MKIRSRLVLLVIVVALATAGGACRKEGRGGDLAKLGPSSAATTTVLQVGSTNCPGGGIGIYSGGDGNNNGVLDPSEIQKGTPVCDPLTDDKKPGMHTTLVMVASEPSGTVHCPAGGLKVTSGPDLDRNGVLDAAEVAFTEYLCGGSPGASSAAGITVAVAPQAPAADKDRKGKKKTADKKKEEKTRTGKRTGSRESARPAAGAATPAAAEKKAGAAVESGERPTKNRETAKPAQKEVDARPAPAPRGWTSVKVNNPQLATVAYRAEGRSITIRFTNLSTTSAVRFKYTVRWKINQNGAWVPDSTMEGISFRLKAGDTLDREVRASAQEIRDLTIEVEAAEAG